MDLLVGYGSIGLCFAVTIATLYVVRVKDKNFTDYSVGGRSFGSWYQTMSFLNTWWPGTVFISFAGLAAGQGVLGFYALSYSLFTVVLMYLIARRVWLWGSQFDLRTQSDLFGMRFNSRATRTTAAVIGIISQFPWIVLGMQALGLVIFYVSFGHLSFQTAVLVGVVLLIVRQYWTIQMGMRGVVVTDFVQGLIAYLLGPLMLIGLIVWLARHGHGMDQIPPDKWSLPGLGSTSGPLFLFSLVFTGAIGGWSWPAIFVRLFTANGVRSLKNSAALGLPISFVFYPLLMIFAMMASTVPGVAARPDDVLFITTSQIGAGVVALAAVVVFAATMGNVDGNLQSNGAQVANDLVADYVPLSDEGKKVIAKVSIGVLTLAAGGVAALNMSGLIILAIVAYQGIVQLAVPQFLGIFWRRGNKVGAIAGMVAGIVTAAVLQVLYPTSIPWLGGLTSGIAGMAVNLAVYIACAYLIPMSGAEAARVNHLFVSTAEPGRAVVAGPGRPSTPPRQWDNNIRI
jgi:SSS family solute:Na+ symporter